MQNHFKPQVEVSLSTAFELANLSFSQFERLTGLNIEQAKVSTELARFDQEIDSAPNGAVSSLSTTTATERAAVVNQ